MEEVLLSLKRRQPVYLSGGFGGATLDIIRALRPELSEWFPPQAGAPDADARLIEGLRRIYEIAKKVIGMGFQTVSMMTRIGCLQQVTAPAKLPLSLGKDWGDSYPSKKIARSSRTDWSLLAS